MVAAGRLRRSGGGSADLLRGLAAGSCLGQARETGTTSATIVTSTQPNPMNDDQGNTPQDRRTVALSTDHERRHFIEQFADDHPGVLPMDVEVVLDEARARIAPSESREKLTEQVENLLGLGS
jgi:hypothetical protein